MTTGIAFCLRNELPISDQRFDTLFPASLSIRSHFHWTPVDVAVRACALLAPSPGMRVLDVGAGVGKLCLVGALTKRAFWWGIERDGLQVCVATNAARRLRVEQHVQFVHGGLAVIDWSTFDAMYFFNPFAETLFDRTRTKSERRDRHRRDIDQARRLLAKTRPGTRVVTYHGLGADMPDCFDLVHREHARSDELCLWIKHDRGGWT